MQSQVNGVTSSTVTGATGTASGARSHVNGGRFDFDDGGTYCGGWEDGKAHGHGVCTGPKGQGAYSGSWHYGFEVSGVYTWPSGSAFEGQWQNGKRHGLGVETRGRWLYRGEWTQGFKGRYGVRQSSTSNAKYEGTWANGLQDGYGSETYADGGTYQGQWLRGMRHGYGVRTSAPFGLASHYRPNKSVRASLTSLRSNEGAASADSNPAVERDKKVDDSRGGFVLKAKSDPTAAPARRRSLVEKSSTNLKSILSKIKKQRSLDGEVEKGGEAGTTGSLRSTASSTSWVSTESCHSGISHQSAHTDSNASFVVEVSSRKDLEPVVVNDGTNEYFQDEMMDKAVTETYMGEWKNDKRSGFGIGERSDGLKYEGEWFNNKKYGYGVTTFKDGTKEEGKYKNNVLITSQKKKHLLLIRSAKFRERIDAAVNAAQRASKFALQKADIAISRTATARGKGELADTAATIAQEDSDVALATAKQFAPDFQQPSINRTKRTDITKIKASEVQNIPMNPSVMGQQKDVLSTNHSTPQRQHSVEGTLSEQQMQQKYPQQQQQQYQQQQQQYQQQPMESDRPFVNQIGSENLRMSVASVRGEAGMRGTNLRRNSQQVSGEPPSISFQQAMSDHFDQYKRPPSRDPSVDRTNKGGARLSISSRQPSVDKSNPNDVDRSVRAPSTTRGATPMPGTGNEAAASSPLTVPGNEGTVRRRTPAPAPELPSGSQPKRTESLFVNSPTKGSAAKGAIPMSQPLQRKKSLPDVQVLPKSVEPMSREEASMLSSARREEIRKMQEESERLRANPLLYFVSPRFKDWFSRQQLILLVLFINICLAIMFFKLLT